MVTVGDRTGIAWTDATWNPTRGCTRVSPGCENCYAERQAHRMNHPGGAYEGLTTSMTQGLDRKQRRIIGNYGQAKIRWTGKVRLVPELLDQPLRWRKPRRIFCDSMSDLFHEDVPDEFVLAVLGICALAPQHTFQILTKRAERMSEILGCFRGIEDAAVKACIGNALNLIGARPVCNVDWTWPLPNVWLGVSVEDQKRADERIPLLLQTPAAVRFVSVEPLLGPLDLSRYLRPTCWHWATGYKSPEEAIAAGAFAEKRPQALVAAGRSFLDWLIAGGESGPVARPCSVEWIRWIVRQCRDAGVACFIKQLGANPSWRGASWDDTAFLNHEGRLRSRAGADPAEWPPDLRVQEFPRSEGTPLGGSPRDGDRGERREERSHS